MYYLITFRRARPADPCTPLGTLLQNALHSKQENKITVKQDRIWHAYDVTAHTNTQQLTFLFGAAAAISNDHNIACAVILGTRGVMQKDVQLD